MLFIIGIISSNGTSRKKVLLFSAAVKQSRVT